MTPKWLVNVIVDFIGFTTFVHFNDLLIEYPIPSADQSSLSLIFDGCKWGVCPIFRRHFLQRDFTKLGINLFKFQTFFKWIMFIFCKGLELTLQQSNVACWKIPYF